MRKFIQQFAAFNYWANNRICEAAAILSDEQFNKEMVSSFPGIAKTLLHLWGAQDVWIMRLDGTSPDKFPHADFNGSKDELIDGFLKSSKVLMKKAKKYGKRKLMKKLSYTTLNGTPSRSAMYEMITHVVNHGTYHRGQLITMLRNAGVTELPATDLIDFYRETGK